MKSINSLSDDLFDIILSYIETERINGKKVLSNEIYFLSRISKRYKKNVETYILKYHSVFYPIYLKTINCVYTDMVNVAINREYGKEIFQWIRNLNIKIKYHNNILEQICFFGDVDFLNFLKKSNYKIILKKELINNACKNGHTNILDWFKKSNCNSLDNYPSKDAIKYACENGHTNILEWYKQGGVIKKQLNNSSGGFNFGGGFFSTVSDSNLISESNNKKWKTMLNKSDIHKVCLYGYIEILIWIYDNITFEEAQLLGDNISIENACFNGHVNILEFLKNKSIPLKYGTRAMENICTKDKVKVAKWFDKNFYELKINQGVMLNAFKCGSLKMINWFIDRGMYKHFNNNMIIQACIDNKIKVLDLLKNRIIVNCRDSKMNFFELSRFKCDAEITYVLSLHNRTNILDWFKNNNIEIEHDEYSVLTASQNGHIKVLEWFKNSNLEFKYTSSAISMACLGGRVNVLEWFKNSEYGIKYDYECCSSNAAVNKHINVLEWLKKNDFEINVEKIIESSTINEHDNVMSWLRENNYV